MSSILQQLYLHAKQEPSSLALVCGSESYTYKQLIDRIEASSMRLDALELRSGDRVALAAEKHIDFVAIYFACHRVGCAAMPLDKASNTDRLNFIFSETKPDVILGLDVAGFRCLSYVELSEIAFDNAKTLVDLALPDKEDTADIIFTTGTTGEPKGVCLSHQNLVCAAHQINAFTQILKDDIELIALPICHSFGLGRLRCVLSAGACAIFTPNFVNTKRIFRLIEQHKVTGFAFVPAAWAYMKKMGASRHSKQAQCLRYIEIGSAPMPMSDKLELMQLFPSTRICMHYGLTEASRSCFIEFHGETAHLQTVGKASPNVEVRAFSDNGIMLDSNTEGELCIKGGHTCSGYLNQSESCHYGEFFRSGDWGSVDSSGYVQLSSRKKELINTGGKKVSPQEIEQILMHHDAVIESACIGITDPDNILGEVIKAYIVPNKEVAPPQFNELITLCATHLENYKIPRYWEWIDSLPKTDSGKIQRHLLK